MPRAVFLAVFFLCWLHISPSACGQILTASEGTIISPNYPLDYSNNMDCEWTIVARTGSTIELTFLDFQLESHKLCAWDFIEIRENNMNGRLISKSCGTTLPAPVISNTSLYIHFSSDRMVVSRGFKASYQMTGYGQNLTASEGNLTSPNYPLDYSNDMDCEWTIVVWTGSTIELTFLDMQLEFHPACAWDYVEVREKSMNGRLLSKSCGTTLPAPVVSNTSLYVHFYSDRIMVSRGFKATYKTIGCGENLTASEGAITSPNYPLNYSNNMNCEWTIVVRTGSTIELTFLDMQLEFHTLCFWDYIEIRENNMDGKLISKSCGSTLPASVVSNTSLYIHFYSDRIMVSRGFKATYQTKENSNIISVTTPTAILSSITSASTTPTNDKTATTSFTASNTTPPPAPSATTTFTTARTAITQPATSTTTTPTTTGTTITPATSRTTLPIIANTTTTTPATSRTTLPIIANTTTIIPATSRTTLPIIANTTTTTPATTSTTTIRTTTGTTITPATSRTTLPIIANTTTPVITSTTTTRTTTRTTTTPATTTTTTTSTTTTATPLPLPCYDYTLLNNATRAVTYNTTAPQCDSLLPLQWYRFQINGADARVPTSCGGPTWNNLCDTHAPLWLDLQGGTLPVPGQQTVGRACASWAYNCCNWSSDGLFTPAVVNCGSYMVYYLQGLPWCHLRWCAQV